MLQTHNPQKVLLVEDRLLQGGERDRLCSRSQRLLIRAHKNAATSGGPAGFLDLNRHPPAPPPAAPSAPPPSPTQGAGAAPAVPAAPALAKSEFRAENTAVSSGEAGIVKLNRPPPPPEPKRPPPPPAWVDKKLAPVIPELLLTEENSGRVVPRLMTVLVGSAGSAR